MISCSDAKNLINDYIDGLLGETDCLSFEEHISCCEKCHNEYDMLKSMVTDLSVSKSPLPADFTKKMHIALVNNQLKEKEGKKKSFFELPYTKLTTVTAAMLMIAVIGKFGVYDVYKDISKETLQTETVSPAVESGQIVQSNTVMDAEHNTSPATASEKSEETVKIVKVVKKEDPIETISPPAENTPTADTTDAVNLTPASPQIQSDVAEETEEATVPFALARMVHPEQSTADFGITDELQETSEEVIEIVPEAAKVALTAETTLKTEEAVEEEANISEPVSSGAGGSNAENSISEKTVKVDEEADAEKNRFALKESTESIPTIVEIYKSGEGNMLTIKNYLYTFLDGSEITESDGQITITIGADEYESVIKRLSTNEYVKNISAGSAFEGKATIIIK